MDIRSLSDDCKRTLNSIKRIKIDAEIYSSGIIYMPVPFWYKKYENNEFHMVICNLAYTEATGITLPAYRGQLDSALWPPDTAQAFSNNDFEVLKSRKEIAIQELSKSLRTGKEQYWVGRKYPLVIKSKVEGVYGHAIPFLKEDWDKLPEEIRSTIRKYI